MLYTEIEPVSAKEGIEQRQGEVELHLWILCGGQLAIKVVDKVDATGKGRVQIAIDALRCHGNRGCIQKRKRGQQVLWNAAPL